MPALREAQLSDDTIVRMEAAAALLRTGDEYASVERLLAAWRDTCGPEEAHPVASHWLWAVGMLGPHAEKAVPRLITLLTDPRDRYDQDDRADAALALGKIGAGARLALPRLKGARRRERPGVRERGGRGSSDRSPVSANRAVRREPIVRVRPRPRGIRCGRG